MSIKKQHGATDGNFVVFLINHERLYIQIIRYKGHLSEPN